MIIQRLYVTLLSRIIIIVIITIFAAAAAIATDIAVVAAIIIGLASCNIIDIIGFPFPFPL